MLTRTLRSMAALVAGSAIVCAIGGCGTTLTPETTVLGASTDTAGVASEAESLANELQAVLGAQSAGADTPLGALLLGLMDGANDPANSSGLPSLPLIQDFQQLRAEIHQLRHTKPRALAAQLLLNALAAGNTVGADPGAATGSSGLDLLSQVQNLLEALRSTNTQPAADAPTTP